MNHDDVIGSRRVSYILYIPLPPSEEWKKEWGGALELYPVREGPDGILEPKPIPTKSIPPSWNQFIFFEVQPGRSFHSVEEVVVDEGEDGRQRLSVSGWFHAAQLGEEGHEPEEASDLKSSREQLVSGSAFYLVNRVHTSCLRADLDVHLVQDVRRRAPVPRGPTQSRRHLIFIRVPEPGLPGAANH